MKFDQHFMVDEELCKRIVDALEIKRNEAVLEIGGGRGALTSVLTRKTKNLDVIELDADLSRQLQKKFPQIKVIHGNALCGERFAYNKITGNLPYSICEPLMKKLLKSIFQKAVLTVPKSFLAEGLLRKIMPLFFQIYTLEYVPRSAFAPRPRTESKIIVVAPRRLKQKAQLVKEVYLQSDKVLKNALREGFCKVYQLTKKESLQQIPELDFLLKKVYMLNTAEWIQLLESLDIRG